MEATLTLDQAGQQLGVDDDALSRLIRMGALPEARQEPSPDGTTWVIPERALPSLAARNGWTIDLRGSRALVSAGGAMVLDRDTAARPSSAETAARPSSGITAARPSSGITAARPSSSNTELVATTETNPVAAGAPSVTEVMDLALLDRLLGAQEQKVVAETQVRETRNALSTLNHNHNRMSSELEVERHERMVVTDRYREERMARAASDAKVTELRNRVTREMALAESERQARAEAIDRVARAERDSANAYASMGWLARRRFRRLGTQV